MDGTTAQAWSRKRELAQRSCNPQERESRGTEGGRLLSTRGSQWKPLTQNSQAPERSCGEGLLKYGGGHSHPSSLSPFLGGGSKVPVLLPLVTLSLAGAPIHRRGLFPV